MNASLTVPVGPLRCLAMMISATPSESEGSSPCLYMSSRKISATTSASCSRAPDSRRSDSIGRLSERASGARDSCDRTITGTVSSLARPLSEREIDASSRLRFSKRPRPVINWM